MVVDVGETACNGWIIGLIHKLTNLSVIVVGPMSDGLLWRDCWLFLIWGSNCGGGSLGGQTRVGRTERRDIVVILGISSTIKFRTKLCTFAVGHAKLTVAGETSRALKALDMGECWRLRSRWAVRDLKLLLLRSRTKGLVIDYSVCGFLFPWEWRTKWFCGSSDISPLIVYCGYENEDSNRFLYRFNRWNYGGLLLREYIREFHH